MFSFCHNFCWLLGESFINCENLTDYCIRLSSPICYLAIYTMRICPEDLSSLNERINRHHISVFLWSYSKDAYDVYSMGRKIVAHSPAPSKCSKIAITRTRSTRITEAIT